MYLTFARWFGTTIDEGGEEKLEWILGIVAIILSLSFLVKEATDFIKNLKSKGKAKLSKGFTASLSVIPIADKKSEDVHTKHPHN